LSAQKGLLEGAGTGCYNPLRNRKGMHAGITGRFDLACPDTPLTGVLKSPGQWSHDDRSTGMASKTGWWPVSWPPSG